MPADPSAKQYYSWKAGKKVGGPPEKRSGMIQHIISLSHAAQKSASHLIFKGKGNRVAHTQATVVNALHTKRSQGYTLSNIDEVHRQTCLQPDANS